MRNFTLFLVLITTVNVFGQIAPIIKWGPEEKSYKSPHDNLDNVDEIYHSDGENNFVIDYGLFLTRYTNLAFTSQFKRNKATSSYNANSKLWKLNNKFYLISDVVEDEYLTISATEVDFATETLNKNSTILFREAIKTHLYTALELARYYPVKRNISVSRDSSKIALAYVWKENYDVLDFSLNVCNSVLNKEYSIEDHIEIDNLAINLVQMEIAKNGNIFMLIDEVDYKGKYPNQFIHNYAIYCYNADGLKLRQEIDLNGNIWMHKKMEISKDNVLRVVGAYADEKGEGAAGICTYNLDCNTLESNGTHLLPFTENLLARSKNEISMSTNKKGRAKKSGIVDLEITDIVLNPNGSLTIIGEAAYQLTIEQFTTHFRNSIYVFNISSDLKYNWMSIIHKKQKVDKPSYASYHLVQKDDELQFIYADNSKNIDIAEFKNLEVYNTEHSSLVLSIVDKDGNLKAKQMLCNLGAKKSPPFRVGKFVKLNDGSILIVAESRKIIQLAY
jgi:hypothetical protein